MNANSFGSRFTITTFGESHGPAMGVVIDGCPAGLLFDEELLQRELKRRRPGVSAQITSVRQEEDRPEILSGVFEGKTLGTPIAMIVRNQDARSADYNDIKDQSRAGHADDVWKKKFGHVDHRGGGRSSGRETVSRVMGGAVARMYAQSKSASLRVVGYNAQVGDVKITDEERKLVLKKNVDEFQARFPSEKHTQIEKMLKDAQTAGESFGGIAEILIHGIPASLGEPVFRKLKSDFAQACLSVGAVNGFELGLGFEASNVRGTEFHSDAKSSRYGGIRGGISTGEDILLRVSFKPTSSILDVAKKGRHDPFIGTRAIPVLEAMIWLVIADHI